MNALNTEELRHKKPVETVNIEQLVSWYELRLDAAN